MTETFESSFEEQLEALATIDQWQQERVAMLAMREANGTANVMKLRDSFKMNKNVKSDVKKSSTFVKKIRTVTVEGIQQCIRDTETLNLNLYISEIVSAILATTYKATELSYVVRLCVSLHQKYEEFTEPLISGLKSIILTVPNEDDANGAKRKRLNIRFAIELHQEGLLNEDEIFCQLMRNLLGKGKLAQMNSSGRPIVDLQGFSMLVKFGAETLFGFLPKSAKEIAMKAEKSLEEIPSKLIVNAKVQGILRGLLTETYDHLTVDLVKAHQDFRSKESKCEKDRLIHGSITEQKQQELDNAKRLFERLLSIVTTLSDATGDPVPELIIEKEVEEATSGLAVFDGSGITLAVSDDSSANGGYFGDAETKSFYEDLPDLLTLVPLSVLGFTPEQAAAMKEEWMNQSQTMDGAQLQKESAESTGADDIDEFADDAAATGEDGGETEGGDASSSLPADQKDEGTAGDEVNSSVLAHKVDNLVNVKLQECITKQKCDEFCTSFCYVNSKSARKKLIHALSRLPKFRMELAPFYARIVASLGRVFPEIVEPVLEALRREFFGILKTRRQSHVDGKVRNVRYQAELVKFRIAPPMVAFRMMRALLTEFSAHNIDMLVAIMETCGRFLFLVPITHNYMSEVLETMMRLRRARHVDLHQQTLLESAYFAVKPPERSSKANKKELTLVQKYARYLILEKLDQPNVSVDSVIKHLRRLPWDSSEENVLYHVTKAVLKVARTKYVALPRLADCVSGLSKYYWNLRCLLMDRILEEIQRSLEIPYKREIQRILGLTRLLGELYNYTAIPVAVVFALLYHVINDGHELLVVDAPVSDLPPSKDKTFDPRVPCEADAPTDLFRAQIVCELLNTTGLYMVRGSVKESLNRFLAYFQRYLLTKQMIPMHIEFSILDCFDNLDNMAKDAALEVAKKAFLEKQGSKGRGSSSRSKKSSLLLPVFSEDMVSGYQFTRFDTFESAHNAVGVYEGKTVLLSAPSTSTAVEVNSDVSVNPVSTSSPADCLSRAMEPTSASSSTLRENVKTKETLSSSVPKENAAMFPNEEEEEVDEDAAESEEDDEDDDEDEDEEGDEEDDDDEEEGDSSENDSEEEDEDDDDDENDDDDDENDSTSDDDEDDDENDDEEDDEDGYDDDEGMSEDEAAKVLEKMRIAEEDDEFERAFKSAMQDSRAAVVSKSVNVDKMTIPAILPKPKNVYTPLTQEDETTTASSNVSGSADLSTTSSSSHDTGNLHSKNAQKDSNNTAQSHPPRPQVAFKLLSRDNKGRIEARQLFVPRDHAMVEKMMKSEEELRQQRERVMERTLLLSAMNADTEDRYANNLDSYYGQSESGRYFGQREVYQGPTDSSEKSNSSSGLHNSGKSSAAASAASAAGLSSSGATTSTAGGMGGSSSGSNTTHSNNSANTTTSTSSSSRVNRAKLGYRSYEDSKRAATTLDLDGFLAESNAAEIRRISSRKNP